MSDPLKVAIAGLGTVGVGTVKILQQHADVIESRCGRAIKITAVCARSQKDRGVSLSGYEWFGDAAEMAVKADADVIVELIGGSEGIARDAVEAALSAGRHVVTANKALVAHHGQALATMAERKGVSLNYEAAVAGGIPVIKSIREGLAGNALTRVQGILNGTCNYILTTMREEGRDFDEVLKDAQDLGYAEADPSFDIDGVDAAHKLAILASVAFGVQVNFDAVHIEGIRHVSATDIEFAEKLGYRIKLLGIAAMTEHGLEQRVHPTMVPLSAPIASVEGVFNAVVTDGDAVDSLMQEGRGAGEGPTASAVVADICDIARGILVPTFGVPVANLKPSQPRPMGQHVGAYYVRMMLVDEPGVFADVAAVLRDNNVSMVSMLQQTREPGEAVPVVLTTHKTKESDMNSALDAIAALDTVVESPRMIRIESA
ncbi:MAG: homoserine dehydrogenase [Candidatus Lindowbacteria bacterium]|nr:homoserine dehydrogenase [Candidatus Lindowbacteria bacterium]